MEVQFKSHNDGSKDIELCQITYDDGRVHAFPANEKIAGSDVTFAQSYPAEYRTFKGAQEKAKEPTPAHHEPKHHTKRAAR